MINWNIVTDNLYIIFIALGCFLNMIVVHEWGHWLYFKVIKGISVDIRMRRTNTGREIICGNPEDYKTMNKLDKILMLCWGMIFGLSPLLVYLNITNKMMILLPLYVVACIPDLKSITEVVKNG